MPHNAHIPQAELDEALLIFTEAIAYGAEDRKVRGWTLLNDGFNRAQACKAPHASALVELWYRMLVTFQERYPTEWYPQLPKVAPLQDP